MSRFTPCRRLALCAGLAAALPFAAGTAIAAGPMVPKSSVASPSAAITTESAPATPPQAVPVSAPATPVRATPDTAQATAPVAPAAATGIAIASWGFSQNGPSPAGGTLTAATAHRPLYLWLTLSGGQEAVDRLRGGGRLAVTVHWSSGNGGARDLTKQLDVAGPSLASTLQGEVAKDGHFVWHSWARKDALTPGHWTVSLTSPDGQPVQCGQAPDQPCQLSIDVS